MIVEEIIIIFVLSVVIFFVVGFSIGKVVGAKKALEDLNKWLIEKGKKARKTIGSCGMPR